MAIFCPDSKPAAHATMRVCQQHAIPCLTAQWDASVDNSIAFNVTVNLHPTLEDVGETLASFLHEAQGWQELGLIYAHRDSKCLSYYLLHSTTEFTQVYFKISCGILSASPLPSRHLPPPLSLSFPCILNF